MKTIVSSLTALAVFGSSLMASSIANAEMSYNVGYVSEYYYRGFFQKNSSASAERTMKAEVFMPVYGQPTWVTV